MVIRRALSVVELLVVLAIIGLLLGLLLPAVQITRERARETVCKNNLHQINTALTHYAEVHKKLPVRNTPGLTGGWTVELLPFVEQQSLMQSIVIGVPATSVAAPLYQPPQIFRCPRRTALDNLSENVLWPGNYILVPTSDRQTFSLFDAPVDVNVPWISSPESTYNKVIEAVGPHSNGFFFVNGFQQGVAYMLNGQIIQ
jgi:type II secretory pathway pseudopilin PulG